MEGRFKRIWHDPVWSKVIAGGILSTLGIAATLLWATHTSATQAASVSWTFLTTPEAVTPLATIGGVLSAFLIGGALAQRLLARDLRKTHEQLADQRALALRGATSRQELMAAQHESAKLTEQLEYERADLKNLTRELASERASSVEVRKQLESERGMSAGFSAQRDAEIAARQDVQRLLEAERAGFRQLHQENTALQNQNRVVQERYRVTEEQIKQERESVEVQQGQWAKRLRDEQGEHRQTREALTAATALNEMSQVQLADLTAHREADPLSEELPSTGDQVGKPARRLKPVEKSLLTWLAIGDGSETIIDLAKLMEISRIRAVHVAETLRDDTGFIHVVQGEVWLSGSGREYVLKNGLDHPMRK